MTFNREVSCLVNRTWNPTERDWRGEEVSGTLIDFSTQSSDDNSGTIIPVAIVMMDDNTFQSIPLEFINCERGN